MKKWTIEDSKELYNINGWGTSYFGINDNGNVYVTPSKDDSQIDLREVMDELALYFCGFPIFWTIASKRQAAASKRQPKNMTTRARTS